MRVTGARLKHCAVSSDELTDYLPAEVRDLNNPQIDLPRIAKEPKLTASIDSAVQSVPTSHTLWLGDARRPGLLADNSVHLVLTSPPYWTLKTYHKLEGQLGNMHGYELFLGEIDRVWRQCFRALVPGGRLICVVGDVFVAPRESGSSHCRTTPRLNPGTLPSDGFRQPISDNMAQDRQRFV